MISFFIVSGAILGVALSLASTRYISEDLFLVGVPIDNYKRYESVLLSGARLQNFLSQTDNSDAEISAQLRPLVDNPVLLPKALKPEFSFTDKDAKAFGVKVDQPGTLLGIRVRHEAREPIGSGPISLLAEYVRDTVIRVDFSESLMALCAQYRGRELALRNQQIASDFAIAQEQKRELTLIGIIAGRPEAAGMGSRQIVAIEKGSERFLPPVTQLTAVEILIADMRLDDARRQRELIASALKRDYYCKAEVSLGASASGRAFIDSLKDTQAAVFAGKDKRVDVVEQTWNELDLQRAQWTDSYLSRMRFAASPANGAAMA